MSEYEIIDQVNGKTYEIHPLCALFPWLEQERMDALKDDLIQHGQHDSIKRFEDKVLDGKNRLRCLIDAGITPILEDLPETTNPYIFVKSMGLHRRDLSPYQRFEISEKIESMRVDQLPKEERDKLEEAKNDPVARKSLERQRIKRLTKEANSNKNTIQKAVEVRDKIEEIKTVAPERAKQIEVKLEKGKTSIEKIHKEIVRVPTIKSRTEMKTPSKPELLQKIANLELENQNLRALNKRLIEVIKDNNLWEQYQGEFSVVKELSYSREPSPKELREAELL